MRRSPPALSCLLGLDVRKRPLADLTPESEAVQQRQGEGQGQAPEAGSEGEGHISLAVQETPSCAHVACKLHNPVGAIER